MTDGVMELFPAEQTEQQQEKCLRIRRTLICLSAAALIVCIVLTCLTNTRNIFVMMGICMGLTAVTGWIVIYFWIFGIRTIRRNLAHAAHLQGEREQVTGLVTVGKTRYRIRGSINICKVRVQTDEGEKVFNVNAEWAGKLREAGQRLTLHVIHGYVAAYAIPDENGGAPDSAS